MKYSKKMSKFEFSNRLYDNYYSSSFSSEEKCIVLPHNIVEYFRLNDVMLVSSNSIRIDKYVKTDDNSINNSIRLEKYTFNNFENLVENFKTNFEDNNLFFLYTILIGNNHIIHVNGIFSNNSNIKEKFEEFKKSYIYKEYNKTKRLKKINIILDGLDK